MSKQVKYITENQFWQIVGLITANVRLHEQENLLHDAYENIVGKDNEGRFWDFYEQSDISLNNIKEKLEYYGIKIKQNKSKTGKFWKEVKKKEEPKK